MYLQKFCHYNKIVNIDGWIAPQVLHCEYCTISIASAVLHHKYCIATIAKVLYYNYCIASIVLQHGGKLSALVWSSWEWRKRMAPLAHCSLLVTIRIMFAWCGFCCLLVFAFILYMLLILSGFWGRRWHHMVTVSVDFSVCGVQRIDWRLLIKSNW